MKFRMKKLAALLFLSAALTLSAACGKADDQLKNDGEAGSQETQETAANGLFTKMEAVDLEGNALDSSIFEENKLTLVNVWNVGCTPCIREIPVLDKLNREYEGKGIAIKGLYYNFESDISDDVMADINEILTAAGAEYTHIVPSKAMYETEEMKNIFAFPTTYFVDSKGNIVDKIEGATDYEGWKERIETVLEKVEA